MGSRQQQADTDLTVQEREAHRAALGRFSDQASQHRRADQIFESAPFTPRLPSDPVYGSSSPSFSRTPEWYPAHVTSSPFQASSSSSPGGQHRQALFSNNHRFDSHRPDYPSPVVGESRFVPAVQQLVPPHPQGAYNPLLNPYIPQPKQGNLEKAAKKSFFDLRRQREVDSKPPPFPPPSLPSPVANSRAEKVIRQARLFSASAEELPALPLSRPSPPTPNRGRNYYHPDGTRARGKSFGQKAAEVVKASFGLRSRRPSEVRDTFKELAGKARTGSAGSEGVANWGQETLVDHTESEFGPRLPHPPPPLYRSKEGGYFYETGRSETVRGEIFQDENQRLPIASHFRRFEGERSSNPLNWQESPNKLPPVAFAKYSKHSQHSQHSREQVQGEEHPEEEIFERQSPVSVDQSLVISTVKSSFEKPLTLNRSRSPIQQPLAVARARSPVGHPEDFSRENSRFEQRPIAVPRVRTLRPLLERKIVTRRDRAIFDALPDGQYPESYSRKVSREDAYKDLFGKAPTDSVFLGGSEGEEDLATTDISGRSVTGPSDRSIVYGHSRRRNAFPGSLRVQPRLSNLERSDFSEAENSTHPPRAIEIPVRSKPQLSRENAILGTDGTEKRNRLWGTSESFARGKPTLKRENATLGTGQYSPQTRFNRAEPRADPNSEDTEKREVKKTAPGSTPPLSEQISDPSDSLSSAVLTKVLAVNIELASKPEASAESTNDLPGSFNSAKEDKSSQTEGLVISSSVSGGPRTLAVDKDKPIDSLTAVKKASTVIPPEPAIDSKFSSRLKISAEKTKDIGPSKVVLPPTSRKVSDLRAKFEANSAESVGNVSRKTTPEGNFVKKWIVTPLSGEKKIPEEQPGKLLSALPKNHTDGAETSKDNLSIGASSSSATPTEALVSARVKENVIERDTAETNYDNWASKEDFVGNFDLPPLIPRKSSRRSKQPQIPALQSNVPSESSALAGQPVTPENKFSNFKEIKGAYASSSVYSQDSDEEYPTPPDKHPDLLPSPLELKNKAEGSNTPPDTDTSSSSSADPFRTTKSFLDKYLSASICPAQMETLQVGSASLSSTKAKAVEDARAMQTSVIESCKKAGKDPPKYVLLELIGKGSFGRVYKGKDVRSTAIVAVKIIDIDESDTLNPRLADTYSEFMKEVNALKILSESKARNINHVIEALPVGKAMWMITEYCGGGSVATLMKPTPSGLKERFIIPILREVAEAMKWVHQAGIIHRDIKCANVLITEEGGVQLCDFGVAGIIETAVDKRSTFIGTPNWMAPELFQGSQYGKEVDIWAFGSMAFEMATGLPPNAMSGVTGRDLGPYLRSHIPRLEGGTYSDGLRSIVAFCLEENPSDRPSIEDVQRHNYLHNTTARFPSSGLSDLVRAFKMWELHGGSRKSLFMSGGAQGPSELSSTSLSDDDWNFSTTPAFDQAVAEATNVRDVINVYGPSVTLDTDFLEETSRPVLQQELRPARRRPPPEALAPLKAPLEKLFDPNTISNYEDNARSHYNQYQNMVSDFPSRDVSDLPLREATSQTSIRDTMIDLDAYDDAPSSLSSFSGMDTIRPMRKAYDEPEDDYESGGFHDFNRPALSDPADNPNRRTQDWKFPAMTPASASTDVSRFPAPYELQRPSITPASGARPALVHHPTEPISLPTQSSNNLMPSAPSSPNRMSLIDLDLSFVEPSRPSTAEPSRPSTADSTTSQEMTSANPFHLERHASFHPTAREPSLYVPEDSKSGPQMRNGNSLQDLAEVSDFSASDTEGNYYDRYNGHVMRSEEQNFEDASYTSAGYEHSAIPNPANVTTGDSRPRSDQQYTMAHFPALPSPPSVAALSGTATHTEMTNEMQRMLGGLTLQLEAFRDVYEPLPRKDRDRRDRGGDSGAEEGV